MGSRRTVYLLAAGAAAAALAAALVAFSLLRTEEAPAAAVAGMDEVTQMLDGVPQSGVVLGRDDAPVTLVEYGDIQCGHCRHFAQDAFPHLVWDYVREGHLKIEFRGLHFIGADSEKALRAALAAGEQDRLWHVLDLLFYSQGPPNTGWVSDQLLRSIGAAVPGVDVERMLADMDSAAVSERIAADAQAAQRAQVPGTPYFELGRTGEELEPFEPQSLSADAFRPVLDELLGR